MAVHVYNRLPSSTNNTTTDSPIKLWNGADNSLNHVRIFGCKAYVRIPESLRTGKLVPRVQEGIYLGPAGEAVHYHRILMLGTNRIKMTRDVYFNEDQPSEATLKLAGELEHGNTSSSEEPDPTLNGKERSVDLPHETNAEDNDRKAQAKLDSRRPTSPRRSMRVRFDVERLDPSASLASTTEC